MELIYLWIENYKNIEKQGFDFSPRFKCEYDEEKNKLIINENKDYVSIFPDNINITAIVGENGVGKSNLTKFFSEIQNLTHSDRTNQEYENYKKIFKQLEYLIVFKDGPFIWVFHPYLNKIVNNSKYKLMYDETIYFHTEFNFAFYNTSSFEQYRYKRELEPLYEKVENHLDNEYFIQTIMESNNNRTLKNIFSQEKTSLDKLTVTCTFTIDSLNTFLGWIYSFIYNYRIQNNASIIHDKESKFKYKIDEILHYFDLNCYFTNNLEDISDEQKKIIIKLMINGGLDRFELNTYEDYLNVLTILFKNNHLNFIGKKLYDFFIKESYFEKKTDEEFEDEIQLKLEIKEEKVWEKYKHDLMKLISHEILIDNLFLTTGTKKVNLSNLSSGEKSILLLKLIINKLINEYTLMKPSNKSLVILLDEPETYLHPNLQKQLINDLYTIFKNIDFEIHFIITTHSPFLLSDLGKNNIVFLDRYKKDDLEVTNNIQKIGNCKNISNNIEIQNTFGANIHTLLSHSFFMKDGLMGEFAKEKINQVYNFITDNDTSFIKTKEEAKNIINLIGEPMLRKELQFLYDEKFEVDDIDKQIREYEKAIEKLKSKKKKND
ncbi:MAG: AAA family ATPase [Aliarcobacter skirrowii]|uniref:AAA family ATPase n=1 Tax=Aliarcobacter skirrowii TaxID=28200 RepID=UPI00242D62FB|nr:AAA family ATPase [Aliarcobacter skirrowii]MDD2509279.1 AAA family ATPase [Aliarcobacter skirrowii]MDD3497411.1 AAA family ATPase [Aliarcobacter skirrowii]